MVVQLPFKVKKTHVRVPGIELNDCRDRNPLKCKFLQYRHIKVNHKYVYHLDCGEVSGCNKPPVATGRFIAKDRRAVIF
jgi:hypothetical protein